MSNHSEIDPAEPSIRMYDEVIVRRMGESAVLVHLSTNRIYELNETGARIWELLERGQSSTEIIRQLCGEFTVSPKEATEAYDQLLTDLLKQGLVGRAGQ